MRDREGSEQSLTMARGLAIKVTWKKKRKMSNHPNRLWFVSVLDSHGERSPGVCPVRMLRMVGEAEAKLA